MNQVGHATVPRPRPWLKALAALVLLGVLALGATLAWLKLHEEELVFRSDRSRQRISSTLPARAERVSIPAADGTMLAGLVLHAPAGRDSGLWVLHLHGNADSAFSASTLGHVDAVRNLGLNVLSFDYRGFGLSGGVASELHMNEDAQSAFEELIRRQVEPQRIIIWGHSLGSGPAVVLAASRPVAALVLFGAFTSLPDAAQATYPLLPVRWMVSVRMDSVDEIGRVHAPVIIVHSADDTLIPFRLGEQLFAAARAPKRFIALHGPFDDGFGGHVDGLYQNLNLFAPVLSTMIGVELPP